MFSSGGTSCHRKNTDSNYNCASSAGAGDRRLCYCHPPIWSSFDEYPRLVGDVNGDGLTDIIGFGETSVTVGLNNGSAFVESEWLSMNYARSPEGGGYTSQNAYPRQIADVNGDGKADVLRKQARTGDAYPRPTSH